MGKQPFRSDKKKVADSRSQKHVNHDVEKVHSALICRVLAVIHQPTYSKVETVDKTRAKPLFASVHEPDLPAPFLNISVFLKN
jgi:hypothetical protein